MSGDNGGNVWGHANRVRLSKGEHEGKEVPVMTKQVGHEWDPSGDVKQHNTLDNRGTAHYHNKRLSIWRCDRF